MTPAVVSTECPNCGAPLGFGDAVRALRCEHCRSPLVVTGQRQVLSYSIARRIAEGDARSRVQFSLPAPTTGAGVATGTSRGRVISAHLHFLPYYRLTAEEIAWRADPRRSGRRPFLPLEAASGGVPPSGRRALDLPKGAMRFTSRVIERNFLAATTSVTPSSLGVRPSALRLQLFDPEKLRDDAIVVAADLASSVARERGFAARDRTDLLFRELLRRQVQIIYFPYWMVTVVEREKRSVSVVDAVSGTIVRSDIRPEAVEDLTRTTSGPSRTLAFHPLVCANCGWDLPFRSDDIVFLCSICGRGWLARDDGLSPLRFLVGADRHGKASCYLPVWRLGATTSRAPVFAPAFRCRRLKTLAALGSRLTRQRIQVEPGDDALHPLVGCALDEEDAQALGRFIEAGLSDPRPRGTRVADPAPRIESSPSRLLWLPFANDGYALRDLHTGAAVPHRFLDIAA